MRSSIAGHVGILRLLARVALDRPAVLPLVLVPLVRVRRGRVHRDEPGVDAGLHVAAVIEELAVIGAEDREVIGMRARAPVAFADEDVAAAARPRLQLVADARHAAGDAARAEHHGEVERLGVGAEVADVGVVEMQLAERARPLRPLARLVEHERAAVDRDDRRAESLDDAQRELRAPAPEVEHARASRRAAGGRAGARSCRPRSGCSNRDRDGRSR